MNRAWLFLPLTACTVTLVGYPREGSELTDASVDQRAPLVDRASPVTDSAPDVTPSDARNESSDADAGCKRLDASDAGSPDAGDARADSGGCIE
jgi:hypothetical protein